MTTLLHNIADATTSFVIPQEWVPTVAYCLWLFVAVLLAFGSYDVNLTTTQRHAVTRRCAKISTIIGAVLVAISAIVIVCGILLLQWQAYTSVNIALTVISIVIIVYKLCLWCAILPYFCTDISSVHRRSLPLFAQLALGVIIFGAMYIVVLLSCGLQAFLPFVILAVVGSLSVLYRLTTRYTAVLTNTNNKPPFSLGSWAICVCASVSILVIMLTQLPYRHYIFVGVFTATVSMILLDYYYLLLSIKMGKFDIICKLNPKLTTKTILTRARYLFVTALTLVAIGAILGIASATSSNITLSNIAVIVVIVGFVVGVAVELLYVRWDKNSTLMPNLNEQNDNLENNTSQHDNTQLDDNDTTTITTDCIATDDSVNRCLKTVTNIRNRVRPASYILLSLYIVASIVYSVAIHNAVEQQLAVALNATVYLTYFLFVLASALLFCMYLPLTLAMFRLMCTTAIALSLMWSIQQCVECVLLWTTNQPITFDTILGIVCMLVAISLLVIIFISTAKRAKVDVQSNAARKDIFNAIQTNFSHDALTANPARRIKLERAFILSIVTAVVLILTFVFGETLAEEKITAGIYISFGVGVVLVNVLNAIKLKLLGAHKLLFVAEHSLTTLALVLSCLWLVFGNNLALWAIVLIIDCMLPLVVDFVLILMVRMTFKQNIQF